MSKDVFYVYMLTNKWHTVLYTGSTNSIEQRHFEHKNKIKTTFTKKYNCNQLVYIEEVATRAAAEKREKQIKGWTRAKKEALIATQNPEWNDLSPLLRGGSFTSFRTKDR